MPEKKDSRDLDAAQEAKELAAAIKYVGLGIGWDRHSVAMGWLLARGAGKAVFGHTGLVNTVHEALRKRGMG